ncbi:PAP2 superfamily protein [Pirellulimonas nuda]|uniref:PAP2 superfamily protein n=1 Tax=Pirellulimonas nuda TaxID=2528009 RepID=A0A518DEP1_9BACT|nr:vanadium-dependent haloperoxidase [Pirellulimonas nuda]QDU89943.1 PAP2 superfamily protein [Pirellulimonas nuda]
MTSYTKKMLPIVAVFALAVGHSAARADIVLDWNATASGMLAADTQYQNPGMASRTMAMMNLAIYDAYAMTSPGGTMFYDYGGGHSSPGMTASSKAAAAQAAYTVLSSIYSGQDSLLSGQLAASLALVSDGAEKAEGIAMGTMIGQSIINSRAGDGFDASSQYMPTNAPGHWQSDPLNPGQQAWGPAWGSMQTFAIGSTAPFAPGPPPSLDSAEYAAAFNEVKSLGAVDSVTRTADQTEIGVFWGYDRLGMGTPMRMFEQVLNNVAISQGNTDKQNAELFAKASVAMADAGIVAWDSKFEHDLWRPVTGIREADTDGNPLTIADPNWVPLGAPGGLGPNGETIDNFTPPFPTYLSGHATFGGALFEVLADFYGRDDISFSLTSDELPGVTRNYTSFSEAMAENGRSRVYLGIHWNFDDALGQLAGSQVARAIMQGQFISAPAVPEPAAATLAIAVAGLVCLRRRKA